MVLGLFFNSSAVAHEAGNYSSDNYNSYLGYVHKWLRNSYDYDTKFKVEVFNRSFEPLDTNLWSTNLDNDTVKLTPGQTVDIKVYTKEKGKYYVCTLSENNTDVFRSRICFRHWYR